MTEATKFKTIVTALIEHAAGSDNQDLQVWRLSYTLPMWAEFTTDETDGVVMLGTDEVLDIPAPISAAYRVRYQFGDMVVHDLAIQSCIEGQTIKVGKAVQDAEE